MGDRIVIETENDFGNGVAVASRKLVEKLMSEEKQEFELSIVGHWAVMYGPECLATFAYEHEAEKYFDDRLYCAKPHNVAKYNLIQVTRKVDFPDDLKTDVKKFLTEMYEGQTTYSIARVKALLDRF